MQKNGKFTMIVNPHAGKKQGMRVAEEGKKQIISRGYAVEMLISTKAGAVIPLLESADLTDSLGIISVGGDGTLFEVINGLMKHHSHLSLPVGIIPVGTGNSFIKDLSIDSLQMAVEVILAGQTKAVDTGCFTYEGGSHFFINLLGAGFVSNVAYRAKKYKLFGALSYIFGVLEETLLLKSTPVRMVIDGKLIERDVLFVEICNSRYTGGNMMMAPGATLDSGLFEVILMNKTTRRKVMKLLPAIFKGDHVDDPAVEVFRGRQISLMSDSPMVLTPDGETFGATPLTAELLPGKITLFAPA